MISLRLLDAELPRGHDLRAAVEVALEQGIAEPPALVAHLGGFDALGEQAHTQRQCSVSEVNPARQSSCLQQRG